MIKQHLWFGVLWKLCACASFAAVNGIVRYLSGGGPNPIANPLPCTMVVFIQNVLIVILVVPWLLVTKKTIFTRKNIGLHAARVCLAVLGVCLWYWGLQHIQIATSIALGFMGPVVTLIGATWFLHEKLNNTRILAICISFVGALFILRPDKVLFNIDPYDITILLPIAATIAFAGSKLITRKLASEGASAQMLTVYLFIFTTPVSLVPAILQWQTPDIIHMPYLLALGFCAAVAHIAFSKAYALAEVTFLMPWGFSKFIFSVLIGYWWFSELPQEIGVYIGMLVIFISTVVISYLERRVR